MIKAPTSKAPSSRQASEQALQVYKGIQDAFVFLKRQQWVTTNYVVLLYAAIAWVSTNIKMSPHVSCGLVAVAIVAGVVAAILLGWFQYDLGKLRIRSDRANAYLFSDEERKELGLMETEHPYGRGWQVVGSLIAVCLLGATLVVVVIVSGPKLSLR